MDKTISILLSYQPFMACLVQRCKLRWTDKCPTAGVRIMPAGVIELLVNPEFFYLQSEAARVGLMWHEMYHLIAGHIEGSYGLDPETANVAMDESINQLIPQRFLPKRAILPEYFRHEKNKVFEYYYNQHLKRGDAAKYQQPKKYEGGVDDEQNKKDLKEQIKKALDRQKELQDKQENLQDDMEKSSKSNKGKDQKSEEKLEQVEKQESNAQDQQDSDQNQDGQDIQQESQMSGDGQDSGQPSSGNSGTPSETQKSIAKSQDKIEDKQEELSEKMQDNGLKDDAETSDDLTDRQKDLRKRMENLEKDMKNSSDKQGNGQQKEMKGLQDEQQKAQQEIEDALNKLEEINKKQQQRQQQKQQGQGQQGQGQPQDGQGQGSGQGQGQKGNGQGVGQGSGDEESPEVMDSHDMWHTSPASPEEQKMSLGNVLSQAIADAERQFGYNSVPMELRQMMEKTMAKPKVNWRTVVRNYYGRCLVNDQVYSRKKPNRKFGYLAPGKSQKFGPKIIVAADCSGSVADAEYMEFMTEFLGIAGEIAEKVEMIFFDTKVFEQKMMLDANMKKIPPRPLSGGTDFQCVIDYANDRKPDLLIVLTDGAAPTPTKPKYPTLWAICGGRDNPSLFGKRVLIELESNRQNTKILGE